MADLTLTQATRNAGATWTENNGAASQTLDYSSLADENVLVAIRNTDAVNAVRVKFATNGTGGNDAADIDVDITASGEAVIVLESMYVKAAATGKATITILDQDDSAFTGSESDVKISAINMPKGLTV